METLNAKPLSSRLRDRLSEPAMLDLAQRLIAIPSENPPGNQYEECARTLSDELDRLGFDHVRREARVYWRRSELARERSTSAVTTM
jgi:acetylornithine deacetylase/succinyl-diaminopimelate desuccinylase-like protein